MTPTRRPNVLVAHWHDVGTHLGCYGAEGVPSANVDAFAAQSFRFVEAFSTAPQCSPARGSLLTGLYPHRNGLMGLVNRGWTLPENTPTLPSRLAAAGYRTALIGEQHESREPGTLGYQEVLASGVGSRCDPVAAAAVDWLTERGRDAAEDAEARPFFASVGFFETHRPYTEHEPRDPGTVHVPDFLPDNEWTRTDLAGFEGSIRAADEAFGRILSALDETGLAESTWVLFTTDHGIAFPGAKGSLYDPGLRVAFVLRPPSAWRGRQVGTASHLTSHLDVLPTVLELAGESVPPDLDGVSHAPWLRGDESVPRTRIYAEKTYHDHYDPTRAVRTTTHKYIRSFEERPRLMVPGDVLAGATARGFGSDHWSHRPSEELYDLLQDPAERTNLATDPAYAGLRRGLAEDLRTWQEVTHDPLLTGPVPDPLAT